MKLQIKGIFLFFFLLSLYVSCFGSDYEKDTAMINRWLNKSSEFLYTKPDSANLILDSVFNKSYPINYKKGLYSAFNQRGIVCFMTGEFEESIVQYDSALNYVDPEIPYERIRLFSNISYSLRRLNFIDSSLVFTEKVLNLAKKNHLDDLYQQTILDLAYSYMQKENYVKAATYYHQVIEDIEKNSDKEYLVKSYSSLALFYYRLGDFGRSKKYFHQAIEYDKDDPDIDFLRINYMNLGLLYEKVKNDYDSAIYYFKKSMNYTPDFDLERNALITDINIGNCFLEQGMHDSAFEYYKRTVNSPLINDYPEYKAAVFTNIGMYHLEKTNLKDAKEYLKKGLNISIEIGNLEFQQKAYLNLFQIDSIRNKHSEALYYFRNYHRISELRNTKKANHELAILDYEKYLIKEKYQNDLLSKENQNQNQKILIQNIIIALIASILIILIIIIVLAARNRKKIKYLNQNLQKSNRDLEKLNHDLLLQKKEMKELLMSKDRFVSILGHDLKNPFTGLLGLLEIIEEDWDEIPDAEKKDGIHRLHESSVQTYRLLEDLLDWGKTQQGLISVSKSEFYLKELVDEIQNIFHLNLKEKRIQLEYHIPGNIQVYTDKKLLSQIIQNFVGNAIKFSYPDSKINLNALKEEQKIKICVTDYGIGIPKDKTEALFKLDKYFNRPGTQNEKSSGMGLILCKEYAKILDAEIIVESKVNSGSTFCVSIDLP